MFFAKPKVLKLWWFWVIQALIFAFGVSVFATDFIVSGVDTTGPKPIFGPGQIYYQLALGLDFLLFIIIFCQQLLNTQYSLVRYQMFVIAFTFILGIVLGITTNLLLPFLTDDHSTSQLGPFWILIPIVGICWIIINAKNLDFIKKAGRFIDQYRDIAKTINKILSGKKENTIVYFSDDVKISIDNVHKDIDKYLEDPISPEIYQGIIKNNQRLAYDNLRFAFHIEQIRTELNNRNLKPSRLGKLSSLPETTMIAEETAKEIFFPKDIRKKDIVTFDEHIFSIEQSINDNNKTYGQSIICFSPKLFNLLNKLQHYSKSSNPMLIDGEMGSGKAMLARAMHYLRTKEKVREITCLTLKIDKIESMISEFIANSSDNAGLLVKNIDKLEENELIILNPLLSELKNRYIYFTAAPDFLNTYPIPDYFYYRFNQLNISSIPLRKRHEDIFVQTIWHAHKYSKNANIQFTGISKKTIEVIKKYPWPGNTRELQNEIQKAIFNNIPPTLSTFDIKLILPTEKTADLTPIELSEKRIIMNYLRKNKYNKTKTKIELGITINTLNSKIDKYKIQLPKS